MLETHALFLEAIASFSADHGLNVAQSKQLQLAMARYLLLGGGYDLRRWLRGFSKEVRFDVRHTLKLLVDDDRYCHCLWRAYYRWKRAYYSSMEQAASSLKVSVRELAWLEATLTPEDRELVASYIAGTPTCLLTDSDIAEIAEELEKTVRGVANHRLRFIAQYDPGVAIEDLSGDLMAEGIRVVHRYEHWGNILMATNYAKAAIRRAAVNLIYMHTDESRARIRQVDTKGDSNSLRVYETTTVSIDHTTNSAEGTESSLHGVIADTSVELPDSQLFLRNLRQSVSSQERAFIDIVLGRSFDESFERYAEGLGWTEELGWPLDNATPEDLAQLAADYLGLKIKDLRTGLRKFFKPKGSGNVISRAAYIVRVHGVDIDFQGWLEEQNVCLEDLIDTQVLTYAATYLAYYEEDPSWLEFTSKELAEELLAVIEVPKEKGRDADEAITIGGMS